MRATTLYSNGTIVTLDAYNRQCEALAECNGTILAVGTKDELRHLVSPATRHVDLRGATLMPGFIDGHSHFLRAGLYEYCYLDLRSHPVGDVRCVADVLRKLKERIAITPPGTWIPCHGYDDTALHEQRHITRGELDALSQVHPLYLRHVSGHLAVVNSCAFRMAGICDGVSNPPGGAFGHDTSGKLSGLMEGPAAINQVVGHMPEPTDEQWQAGLDVAVRMYTEQGVTTAQDGAATPAIWRHLFIGHARGALECRVHMLPLGSKNVCHVPHVGPGTSLTHDHMLSLGAVKLQSDGSIQGYTGYLTQPYATMPQGREDSNWCGYPAVDCPTLTEQVIHYHKQGRQIAVHGNGDAAIDDILHAFATAQQVHPVRDIRHIVVHAQMAREDQLDTMQRLAVIPSFFPAHIFFWGDRHRSMFLGPERAARINPLRSVAKRFMPFTLHNDTPITPMNPLLLLWAAVNRRTSAGYVLGEAQRISVLDGLHALTTHAAYQFHEETCKGSLEPGKLADCVVLDKNPLHVAPESLNSVQVLATIVGGKTVYGSL